MDQIHRVNIEYEGYEYDPKQRPPPQKYQERPRVEPEDGGDVSRNVYPQAKVPTRKVRGCHTLIFGSIDQELLVVKTFYFFFYSAFGSFFPLMGVYFKQMGMNPWQAGLLIGIRPFVECLSAPFWGSYADRYKHGKLLLLASLTSWILFTLPLGFIQPPATSCIVQFNGTSFELRVPLDPSQRIRKSSTDDDGVLEQQNRTYHSLEKRSVPPISHGGTTPIDTSYADNYIPNLHKDWVSPPFSSIVYTRSNIQKAFFMLFLLIVIGEFFSAPSITLADSAVITLLGKNADRYGHQRMFGSLGWSLAMLFVGIALDHSMVFPNHSCGPEKWEKYYGICFVTFSVLMGAALLTATQISFKYEDATFEEQYEKMDERGKQRTLHEDKMQNQMAEQLQLPSLSVEPRTRPADDASQLLQQLPALGTKMFAQTTREIPNWRAVISQGKGLKRASFLFVAWFMGFGAGLIFTFLFWHLQDYGGTPTLFGVASVINHISEIFAYFFSFRLIARIGHVKVLCLGLAGNILRFLFISYLRNPWYVLPVEFVQGITNAGVWAACCSYIAHNTPQRSRSSARGVLRGLHHGLGRGCGAVIGGLLVRYLGTSATFRGYGIICIFVLCAFVLINFCCKEEGFGTDIPHTKDSHKVTEETAHLTPHGALSNSIPRSSHLLNDFQIQHGSESYGDALDVPGGRAGA